MGQALTRLSGGLVAYLNASREQETRRERSSSRTPLDDAASSSSAPLAVIDAMLRVSVGRNINPSEAVGHELPESAMYYRRRFLLELAEVLPHFIARGRGRNGGDRAWIELLVWLWCRDYELEVQRRLDYDLEARQAHREAANNLLESVLVQVFGAFLPSCVTALPLVKDAPDYFKFTIFGGLAFITVCLYVGILSKSVARHRLAIKLVSFSAITVLTFSVASQFSSRAFTTLTALIAVVVNLIIMMLPF